jgi:hypothetical protein
MRRGHAATALLNALIWSCGAGAADLAYVGQPGVLAEPAIEVSRSHLPTFDRSVALATSTAVVDAVKSGQAVGGLITAPDVGGMPAETAKLLLAALDPAIRIVGEARIEGGSGTAASFWIIARGLNRMPDLHPDRIVVNVDAPAGSKAFSLVVAGLSKLGFTVTGVASVPLPERPFGARYLLVLAADRPILVLRATDAIVRDSRVGEGRALLIGAWKQGS